MPTQVEIILSNPRWSTMSIQQKVAELDKASGKFAQLSPEDKATYIAGWERAGLTGKGGITLSPAQRESASGGAIWATTPPRPHTTSSVWEALMGGAQRGVASAAQASHNLLNIPSQAEVETLKNPPVPQGVLPKVASAVGRSLAEIGEYVVPFSALGPAAGPALGAYELAQVGGDQPIGGQLMALGGGMVAPKVADVVLGRVLPALMKGMGKSPTTLKSLGKWLFPEEIGAPRPQATPLSQRLDSFPASTSTPTKVEISPTDDAFTPLQGFFTPTTSGLPGQVGAVRLPPTPPKIAAPGPKLPKGQAASIEEEARNVLGIKKQAWGQLTPSDKMEAVLKYMEDVLTKFKPEDIQP